MHKQTCWRQSVGEREVDTMQIGYRFNDRQTQTRSRAAFAGSSAPETQARSLDIGHCHAGPRIADRHACGIAAPGDRQRYRSGYRRIANGVIDQIDNRLAQEPVSYTHLTLPTKA